MKYRNVKAEFSVRFYRWALADAQREVKQDFPFLRAIKSGICLDILYFMDSLSPGDRLHVAIALVKRRHPHALAVTGEYLTAKDKQICEAYLEATRFPTPARQEFEQQLKNDQVRFIKRKTLKSKIKQDLSFVFNVIPELWSANQWVYPLTIEGWDVKTYIDVGGNFHQLSYSHKLGGVYYDEWGGNISIVSWLGIAAHTHWDLVTGADLSPTVQTLGKLCDHFMKSVPSLLEGLDPPESDKPT